MSVGAPATIKPRLDALLAATKADELMVTTMIFDHAARKHSYELLAQAFGLEGGVRPPSGRGQSGHAKNRRRRRGVSQSHSRSREVSIGQAVHTDHRRQAFARRLSRRSARQAEGRHGGDPGDFRRQSSHPRGLRSARRARLSWRWRRPCSTASCAISNAAIRRTKSRNARSYLGNLNWDHMVARHGGRRRRSQRCRAKRRHRLLHGRHRRRSSPPAAFRASRPRLPITAA